MQKLDQVLLNVAKKLTTPVLITDVGLKLGVPSYTITAEIKNNIGNIVMAAYDVLQAWRQDVTSSPEDARSILRETLEKCGQSQLAKDELNHVTNDG